MEESLKEQSPVLSKAIEMLRQLFGGLYIEVLSEMIQKYPDSYAKNGYWGVEISVSFFDHPKIPKHRMFFKHQFAEDMMIYNNGESFIYPIIKDDLPKIFKLQRKLKLEKINEFNECRN